jgi:hypothetical protein
MMHASVQGSMSFTGHAKSAVTQIYSRYTEKGVQGRHQGRKLPASSTGLFCLPAAWQGGLLVKFLRDVKQGEYK